MRFILLHQLNLVLVQVLKTKLHLLELHGIAVGHACVGRLVDGVLHRTLGLVDIGVLFVHLIVGIDLIQ